MPALIYAMPMPPRRRCCRVAATAVIFAIPYIAAAAASFTLFFSRLFSFIRRASIFANKARHDAMVRDARSVAYSATSAGAERDAEIRREQARHTAWRVALCAGAMPRYASAARVRARRMSC